MKNAADCIEPTYTYTNFLGQPYKTTHHDGQVELTEFDAYGRPQYRTDLHGVITKTEYNAKGEVSQVRQLSSGSKTESTADPLTEYLAGVEESNGKVWKVSTVKAYNADNSATVVKTAKTSADGTISKVTEFGRTTSTVRSYATNDMTETITNPDGSTVINSYAEGLLETSTHGVLGITAYDYKWFNELDSVNKIDGNTDVQPVTPTTAEAMC